MNIRIFPTVILISYILLIFSLTSIPGNSLPLSSIVVKYDKLVHFIEYTVLGYLFINSIRYSNLSPRLIITTILFLIIIPITDESIQRFIPGRVPDVLDAVVDMAGGLTGAAIRYKILR